MNYDKTSFVFDVTVARTLGMESNTGISPFLIYQGKECIMYNMIWICIIWMYLYRKLSLRAGKCTSQGKASTVRN